VASLVLFAALAAPAEASADSGIRGRVLDATCYGPCTPSADPEPYRGEATITVRRLPERELVRTREPGDEGRFRARVPARHAYRVRVKVGARCWQGDAERVWVHVGEFERVRLTVTNICVV
jgi:hypothetical protein